MTGLPMDKVVAIGLLLCVLAIVNLMLGKAGNRLPRVRPVPLMTYAERRVIGHIEAVLPQARIHAQVSMGAFLAPRKGLSRSQATSDRNRFSSKRVDFLAEDKATGEIIAIIELDDRTHNRGADARRDAMTASAGYRTIRLPAGVRHDRASVFRAIHGPPHAH